MHPHLLRIGPWSISSYGAMLAVAFLLVVGLLRHATTHVLRGHVPLTEAAVMDWAVWAVMGGILGGRLLYVVLNWEMYRLEPSEIVALWHGGLIWYGGLAGGVLGTAIYLRTHHHPFLRGMDQVIPFIPLGHAIGRIGCFLNGCCYGKPTTAWFGVQFPGHPGPVVPTQLIESAGLVVLFAILWTLQTPARLRRPG
ncbi:MAG: prolipoprotein diacylglyceryl transferase, partial [Candidatus Omnitrophica bacterium]|nr:prolipoprotein diacylglyceryl transferase [Candidatus Omnitrophota bacterium]